jgi:two-component system response regulator HydG
MTTPWDDELEPYAVHALAGMGAAIRRLRLQIERLAPHYRVALVTGESGTGKHAVAQQMHRSSPVAERSLIAVTAGAFAEDAQEWAEAGTLLLDGVGAVRAEVQARMVGRLSALPREMRVLVLADGDPKGMVAAGRLRPELYQKLGMLEIRVPALRERTEDMAALAGAMLRRMGSDTELTEPALDKLCAHDWRGNLRELWQVCGQIAGKAPLMQGQEIPELSESGAAAEVPMKLEDVVRRHVMGVLERCAGNKLQAAETLGISRSTLYRMLESKA